jgi:Tfp pilus assembly protein PilX
MNMNIKADAISRVDNEKGFAFVMALLCMLLLTSLGFLVFTLTMKDQITSAKIAAEAKSLSAAEHGVATALINFVPGGTNSASPNDPTQWPQVSATDTSTRFYYSVPATATPCPAPAQCKLTNCVGQCYDIDVRGANVNFVSQQRLAVGVRTAAAGNLASTDDPQ